MADDNNATQNGNGAAASAAGQADAKAAAPKRKEPVPRGKIFASDLWKIILNYLYTADNNQLWQCRLVCRDLKTLAEEILKERATFWATAAADGSSWTEFLKSVKGTRFSSVEDIDKFIADIGYAYARNPAEMNPFPNGTVILTCKIPPTTANANNHRFFYTLATLAVHFADKIHRLVYTCIGDTDMDEVTQFLRISKLQKLKSLAIYKPKWNQLTMTSAILLQELNDRIVERMETTKVLEELLIFGEGSFRPLFSVIPAFKNVVKSLRKIRISCYLGIGTQQTHGDKQEEYQQVHTNAKSMYRKFQFPVTHLKVIDPFDSLLIKQQDCGIDISSLKKLSVTFSDDVSGDGDADGGVINSFPIGQRISRFFVALDASGVSQNLEELYMEIDNEITFRLTDPSSALLNPPLDDEVKYEKLKHFIFKYDTLLRWGPLPTELLKMKFIEVKKVTLIINAFSEIRTRTPKEFHDNLVSLVWKTFPESVEIIHVPFFGFRLKRYKLQILTDYRF